MTADKQSAAGHQQIVDLYQQGNLQTASQLAEPMLRKTPDDATLLEITAAIALQTGNTQQPVHGPACDRRR